MKSILKEHWGFIVIASVFFTLGILRLNDLSLYTDCTRYLIWGNSIAHGKGLVDDTQPEPEYYIFNAPFYSVVLAPALLFFPFSLTAAKIWTLLLGILALLLFYIWLRKRLGPIPTTVATLFLALNPLTLIISTEVLSETSFLCAIFSIMLLVDKIEQDKTKRWLPILLIAIISLTMLLREVGAAIVAATSVFLFIRKRKILALAGAAAALLFFALWSYHNLEIAGTQSSAQKYNLVFILRHFVTPPDTTLAHEFLQRLVINFKSYSAGLKVMLLYLFPANLIVNPLITNGFLISFSNAIKQVAVFLLIPLFALGVLYDIKHSHAALLRVLFILLYFLIILLYPVKDIRFLFPLIPFTIYFTVLSSIEILKYLSYSRFIRPVFAYTGTMILLFPNIICLYEIIQTNLSYRKDPVAFTSQRTISSQQGGYFSISWKILGGWIDQNIPDNFILASPDKEIVPFAPRHKFLELNRAVTLPTFESLLRNNAVEYLLAPTVYDSLVEYQTMIDESGRFRFTRIYNLNQANIFHIESKLEKHIQESPIKQSSLKINIPSSTVRLGRLAVLHEKYPEALSILSNLHSRYPHRTDILYQLLLVHTFTLDSVRAAQYLQDLYVSPNSTSYTAPAQAHIYAMHTLLHAQSLSDSVQRAELLYDIGRLYWKLGYPRQAYHIMQQTVELDSNYFIGYLWAWHYGIQAGDTEHVKVYLKKLESIDRENPIVRGFNVMTACRDSLRHTTDHQKRAELHLRLSREYEAIDLPDEALDEAQRAVGENPTNAGAWRYLAGLFEKRNNPFAVKRALQKASEAEDNQTLNSSIPQARK